MAMKERTNCKRHIQVENKDIFTDHIGRIVTYEDLLS